MFQYEFMKNALIAILLITPLFGLLGTMIVNGINTRDYMLIQGMVLFFAMVFVVINLIVDLVYMVINPRVSYEGGGA